MLVLCCAARRSDIDLKLTGWEEGEDELRTKWRFSAILDLPWKPLLAAAGGTTFVFDGKSGLVTKHIESWDVEPARVLRQLLKPSAKVPATQVPDSTAQQRTTALHDMARCLHPLPLSWHCPACQEPTHKLDCVCLVTTATVLAIEVCRQRC